MSKTIVALIAGAAGFAAGLYVARLYAQNKLDSGIASALGKLGITNPTAVGIVTAVGNQQVFAN